MGITDIDFKHPFKTGACSFLAPVEIFSIHFPFMKSTKFILILFTILICLLNGTISRAQKYSSALLYKEINNSASSDQEPKEILTELYRLKNKAEKYALSSDTTLALLYHKLGLYEAKGNYNNPNAIAFTKKSVEINTALKTRSNLKLLAKSYSNIGFYYKELLSYEKAIAYFDSSSAIAKKYPDMRWQFAFNESHVAYIYFLAGDYQKCNQVSILGLQYANKEDSEYLDLLIQKLQSHYFQNQISEALAEAEYCIQYATQINDQYSLASALKIKAMIYEKNNDLEGANKIFKESLSARIKSNPNNPQKIAQIAGDYSDYGKFYMNKLHNFTEAKNCFLQSLLYAEKDSNLTKKLWAFNNLMELNFHQKKVTEAIQFYHKTISSLNRTDTSILQTPLFKSVANIGNKDLSITIFADKAALLLQLYLSTKNEAYIKCCVKTCMLTDSIITQTRHEQFGEKSKLYWRDYTRPFFTLALEASYLSKNSSSAFYFMERSRSVLLNDNINELDASLQLSAEDAEKEQEFRSAILLAEQQMANMPATNKAYNALQTAYFTQYAAFEKFIHSLEVKYPAYYQYKYADAVPSLQTLQQKLALNRQSFVHYFMNDTVTYMLAITAKNTVLTKLYGQIFNKEIVNQYLGLCANKNALNNTFSEFASRSNQLYKTIFEPLQLPKGKVVICSDNFLLPFESFCSDTLGSRFLLYDYIFSYAYSATFLLKENKTGTAKGNFIGFAPVDFNKQLAVQSLTNSATALKNSAGNYNNTLLYTYTDASKKNFLLQLGNYTVANIFSHASADTSGKEPVLYMQDTTINLSELQMIHNPATRLVVLSACQTNVGKNATGEGIYSLARGFASAGIPSVSATLWQAEETSIYTISAQFHKYLAAGLKKDEALHKAKLDFLMANIDNEKSLPYFWANMVLIGNTDAITLYNNNTAWYFLATLAAVLLVMIFVFIKKKNQILFK